jgi:hypothetical protein
MQKNGYCKNRGIVVLIFLGTHASEFESVI